MKARKVMNLDRSGACTHGPGTTNLYPANIRGGGGDHRSRVREGVVRQWGDEENLFWDSCSKFFGKKCLARMTSHLKEVNMS